MKTKNIITALERLGLTVRHVEKTLYSINKKNNAMTQSSTILYHLCKHGPYRCFWITGDNVKYLTIELDNKNQTKCYKIKTIKKLIDLMGSVKRNHRRS